VRVVRKAAFRAVPWKNGGGITHEALRVPPEGDPFRWRVSVAEVASSGPFSDFSGYRRSMTLLEGQGLHLRFADGKSVLLREPGELVEFDGGLRAEGVLLAGPCTDLNLIVANDLPAAAAQVARLETPLRIERAAGELLLIFAISGSVAVTAADTPQAERLAPWDLGIVSGCVAGTATLDSADAGAAAQVFFAKLSDNASCPRSLNPP
jgi:environmental stress-induced protein Ves